MLPPFQGAMSSDELLALFWDCWGCPHTSCACWYMPGLLDSPPPWPQKCPSRDTLQFSRHSRGSHPSCCLNTDMIAAPRQSSVSSQTRFKAVVNTPQWTIRNSDKSSKQALRGRCLLRQAAFAVGASPTKDSWRRDHHPF
jgi:hypothetical protein